MARPRDNRQADLLRPQLDQIINLKHPLVLLAEKIDWQFIDGRFASVCAEGDRVPWSGVTAAGSPRSSAAGLVSWREPEG